MHMFSTVMVALGAHFSAIWIVVADSGCRHRRLPHCAERPAAAGGDRGLLGHGVQPVLDGPAGSHGSGAWQAAAFLVLSVSAYYLLKRRHLDFAKASMRIGLVVAVFASFGRSSPAMRAHSW